MKVLPVVIDQQFGESGSGVNVVIKGEPKPLNEDVQEEAIWIVKEALANARQHSGADEIDVLITFNARDFRIAVKDNGCGFRPDAFTASNSGHFGLAGMRERSESVGGRLDIQSSPSEGTRVEFTVSSRIAYTRMRERFRNPGSPSLEDDERDHWSNPPCATCIFTTSRTSTVSVPATILPAMTTLSALLSSGFTVDLSSRIARSRSLDKARTTFLEFISSPRVAINVAGGEI